MSEQSSNAAGDAIAHPPTEGLTKGILWLKGLKAHPQVPTRQSVLLLCSQERVEPIEQQLLHLCDSKLLDALGQQTSEGMRVITAESKNKLTHQEQGNAGVAGNWSFVTALSVPRSPDSSDAEQGPQLPRSPSETGRRRVVVFAATTTARSLQTGDGHRARAMGFGTHLHLDSAPATSAPDPAADAQAQRH